MNDFKRKFNMELSEEKRKATLKECIWGEEDESNCSGKIIKSHSIQRSKILQHISDNGKVQILTLSGEENGIFGELNLEGTKKFSTFTGFCAKHDKKIFQPIEDCNFIGDIEQKYIYAYRSASKEYHAKKESTRMYDNQLTKIKNSLNPKINELETTVGLQMFQAGLSMMELSEVCKLFKCKIESKEFSGLKHHYYTFKKEYPVACSTVFVPYKDFNGNEVLSGNEKQFLAMNVPEKVEDSYYMFLNIFPENGKTHVLISYFKSKKNKYKFINKLFKDDENKISLKLSNFILNYAENTAFSPTYINEKYTKEEKSLIETVFRENISDPNKFIKTTLSLFR